MHEVHGTFDVGIVGGGASGTLVAIHLLRAARSPLRLALVERGALARGPAYSTQHPRHLLNVRAGGMSASPDEPDDFVTWLAATDPGASPDAFAERQRYGPYLEARLREAEANATHGVSLSTIQAAVERVRPREGAFSMELDDGRELRASKIVLALGNAAPPIPPIPATGIFDGPRFVRSPWSPGAIDGRWATQPVLLLGTGLTMVDTVLALEDRGHVGGIVALSRHGLLPRVHAAPTGSPPAIPVDGIRSIAAATRMIRRACERADWRAVFDHLRTRAASLWASLPPEEKRRFVRHLRTWWDVHRHRMPPQVAVEIDRLRSGGALRVHAGRLVELRPHGGGVEARYRPRGTAQVEVLRVGHVIDCMGPDPRAAVPPIPDLLRIGLATPGPLGMGLATDGAGALLSHDGVPSQRLFTLGSLRRGELWETTAIPEIREQAWSLAHRLLEAS